MKLKEKLKKKQPEKKNKGTSEKKSFKEKIKSSFNGKYIKNGSYSMLISVIRSFSALENRRKISLKNWIRT